MKLLALDTSTRYLCLGIYDDGKIYEYHMELGVMMSAFLITSIKRVLEASGIAVSHLDYVACGLGPGSFTGMRIGVAAVKGICWAKNLPVIGISTLDVLAYGAGSDEGPVVAVVDARRSLIYAAVFRRKKGRLTRVKKYMLAGVDELVTAVPSGSVFTGDAILRYRDTFTRSVAGARCMESGFWYPKARHLITLALENIRRKKVMTAARLVPLYLYPKECQIRCVTTAPLSQR